MRYVCLVLALLAMIGGCFSGDGGGVTLASGTQSVTTGGTVTLADVSVSEPGLLQARVTWSGGPTEIACLFTHVGPGTLLGLAQSPTPVMSSVAVTADRVAASHQWRLIAINSSGPDVTVTFTITFTPE